ncbi:DUF742 domain-containing protein [Streptomyces sp. NPDC058417]|uniref:DUF742 domain-containing protein n=1 Tax=unclassified Streptomyces TaxID=2593676 RepID=UPI00364C7F32
MNREPVDIGDPDRLYMITGGRSEADEPFDVVTLIVSESAPTAGMQSEHRRILDLCRHPTAVVEVSAELRLPITVVRILLGDLHAMGKISARHPRAAASVASLPETALLQEVLVGLRNL